MQGVTYEQLVQSEASPRFRELAEARMAMGALRYGRMADKKSPTRLVPAMRAKLEEYFQTGNTELLVDVANYAMLEFEFGDHPKKHFRALDR